MSGLERYDGACSGEPQDTCSSGDWTSPRFQIGCLKRTVVPPEKTKRKSILRVGSAPWRWPTRSRCNARATTSGRAPASSISMWDSPTFGILRAWVGDWCRGERTLLERARTNARRVATAFALQNRDSDRTHIGDSGNYSRDLGYTSLCTKRRLLNRRRARRIRGRRSRTGPSGARSCSWTAPRADSATPTLSLSLSLSNTAPPEAALATRVRVSLSLSLSALWQPRLDPPRVAVSPSSLKRSGGTRPTACSSRARRSQLERPTRDKTSLSLQLFQPLNSPKKTRRRRKGEAPRAQAPTDGPRCAFCSLYLGTFPVRFGRWRVQKTHACPVTLQNTFDRTLAQTPVSPTLKTPNVESQIAARLLRRWPRATTLSLSLSLSLSRQSGGGVPGCVRRTWCCI